MRTSDATLPDWHSGDQTFLISVCNVSPDQPYTIIQAPIYSTAQDIITQVFSERKKEKNMGSVYRLYIYIYNQYPPPM